MLNWIQKRRDRRERARAAVEWLEARRRLHAIARAARDDRRLSAEVNVIRELTQRENER